MFDYPRLWARYTGSNGATLVMYWYSDDADTFTDGERGITWTRSGGLIRAIRRPDDTDPKWEAWND